jgi:hypothetical protein
MEEILSSLNEAVAAITAYRVIIYLALPHPSRGRVKASDSFNCHEHGFFCAVLSNSFFEYTSMLKNSSLKGEDSSAAFGSGVAIAASALSYCLP